MGSTPQGDSHASVRSFLLLLIKDRSNQVAHAVLHGLNPLKANPMQSPAQTLHMLVRLHGLNPSKVTPVQRCMLLFVIVIRSKLLNNTA